jgi:transposase
MGAGSDAERPSYEELAAGLVAANARVAELEVLVGELRLRLGKNSRNSSKPPSSDGYSKPPVSKDRSLRRRSGRKPGGQEGHGGAHLARVEVPDEEVGHDPEGSCEECGRDLADAELIEGGERRQVFDLPEQVVLRVVEHVARLGRCVGCGRVSAGRFPEGVGAPTQYGERIKALGVYLHVFQHIPYNRACLLIFDLAGAEVSTGTLKAWVDQAAAGLTGFDEELRKLLIGEPVIGFDETGARIAGRLGWVHVACTEKLTRYSVHEKRGTEAIDNAGVLPQFKGVALHDSYASYATYTQARHALCGAHHLRELIACQEAGEAWACAMGCLLLDAYEATQEAKAAGRGALGTGALAELHENYREVIAMGHEGHPGLAENAHKRMKRSDAENLLLRLDAKEEEVLRFAHDFRVRFDNNLSESDIRMVKLQIKISGCWRTMEGAERFLRIRSYISTARKQGQRPLPVLSQLASGAAWTPAPG